MFLFRNVLGQRKEVRDNMRDEESEPDMKKSLSLKLKEGHEKLKEKMELESKKQLKKCWMR